LTIKERDKKISLLEQQNKSMTVLRGKISNLETKLKTELAESNMTIE